MFHPRETLRESSTFHGGRDLIRGYGVREPDGRIRCLACDQILFSDESMRSHVTCTRHKKNVAELDGLTPEPASHVCSDCGDSFSRAHTLGKHYSRAHNANLPSAFTRATARYRSRSSPPHPGSCGLSSSTGDTNQGSWSQTPAIQWTSFSASASPRPVVFGSPDSIAGSDWMLESAAGVSMPNVDGITAEATVALGLERISDHQAIRIVDTYSPSANQSLDTYVGSTYQAPLVYRPMAPTALWYNSDWNPGHTYTPHAPATRIFNHRQVSYTRPHF